MKSLSLIGGICGVLSGIGIIYAAIADGNIPKAVWVLFAIGWIIAVTSEICCYRYFRKNGK